ncbi:integrase core domain-containing protein [Xanthobacter variabilis]|uniref:integrase core domain-containing protein n=1 Tax=Xanthobacter variabilis TaxID=3119932 RepID=UPI00372D37EC
MRRRADGWPGTNALARSCPRAALSWSAGPCRASARRLPEIGTTSRQAKLIQNAVVEDLNGRLHDESLNQPAFSSLGEARRIIKAWPIDDNPHAPTRVRGRSRSVLASLSRESPRPALPG